MSISGSQQGAGDSTHRHSHGKVGPMGMPSRYKDPQGVGPWTFRPKDHMQCWTSSGRD